MRNKPTSPRDALQLTNSPGVPVHVDDLPTWERPLSAVVADLLREIERDGLDPYGRHTIEVVHDDDLEFDDHGKEWSR